MPPVAVQSAGLFNFSLRPGRMAVKENDGIPGVLARLKAVHEDLGRTGRQIASYIIDNPGEVVHMSITEVAQQADASEGSVIALCKRIGLTGFQQLKLGIASDLVKPVQFIHEDLEAGDTPAQVVNKIVQSNIQALLDTQGVLSIDALQKATEAIRSARRVEVYGIGSAATIAEDAHYRMLRIGIDSKVEIDSHRQAISAAMTGPEVATLTVSHSGSTRETLDATRLAKEAGATTICITNYGKSPIQSYSDIVLYTMAKETKFRTEAMTSRIAQLCIVDALIACLAMADYDRSVETIRKTFDILSLKRR